jgi:hypothetical protein
MSYAVDFLCVRDSFLEQWVLNGKTLKWTSIYSP